MFTFHFDQNKHTDVSLPTESQLSVSIKSSLIVDLKRY